MSSHQRRLFYRATILFSLTLSLVGLCLMGSFTPSISQAATSSEPAYAWGGNSNGQPADSSTANRAMSAAIRVNSEANVGSTLVGASSLHSFATLVSPTLSINNVTKAEGNSGITNFIFTVTLSSAVSQTVTVNYTTSDGTATAGSDYTVTSGSLLFLSGATTATITVSVNGDTTYEPDETFFVTLSNPSGATLGTAQGTGTILNDDLPSLSIGNVSQAEGNTGTTNFNFNVTLSAAYTQTVTVSYATSDGTATAGSDYTATSGTLSFAPGTTSQTITVPVNGDTTYEPDETFFVTLSNPSGATLATNQGTGTILNDDPPTLSISSVNKAEGNSGTTSFMFTVTLSAAYTQTVTVNYATSDGTATAGSDYTATSGTLTFAPGITSRTISVAVNGDTTLEPNETFLVKLSNPTGGVSLAVPVAVGTILNDEGGVLYSSGANNWGQFGKGTTVFTNTTPSPAILPVAMTAISVGYYHTLAIGVDSKLYAWGRNTSGQLGDGTTTTRPSPVAITLANGVSPVAISASYFSSFAIGSDGNLYAWGDNSYGQLGDGTTINRSNPVTVSLASGVMPTAISAAFIHTMAIGSDGNLYAWGFNGGGALGDGTQAQHNSPEVITLTTGVKPRAIAGGLYHSLAIGSDDKLYAWGANTSGALGDGTSNNSFTPISVTLASGVTTTQITAGAYHSAAIGSDGKFYTWGKNDYGQLCNGTTTNSSTPIAFTLASGVNAVGLAAGWYNSLAIGSDGKLYECGRNDYGQLGNGTATDSSTLLVRSLPSGATHITAVVGQLFIMAMVASPALNIGNVSQAEGNSGTTSFSFPVTLTYASSQTVTVNYTTSNGTATAGSDYTATSGTLTFAPGTITQTINVSVSGDALVEPDETFFVNLSNPSGATQATSQGTGTILNDDTTAISIGSISQAEGNSGTTSFSFPVTLTYASSQTVTVNYVTSDGTAIAGSDYIATSGALTFAPGTTTMTITVAVLGDSVVEPDETFTVTLSSPSGATLATNQATGTILNDDTTTISINNVYHAEGNSGTTNFNFNVTLSAVSYQTVTVSYATSDNTATAGSDYTATSGTLSFAPGTTSQTITVPVIGDTTYEPDETFFVTLSNPTGATLGTDQGIGTILNDDLPSLSIGNVSQAEGNTGTTNFNFNVTLSAASYQTVTVNYATSDGTATAGSDYTATSGTLSFAPGTTTGTITVPALGDTLVEPDETFFVNLSNPTGATLATSQGTGTIINDDTTAISIGSVSLVEGNSGTTSFSFPVSLTYASSQTVTVNYATSDGTATAGSDYTAASGTLTFAPGTTSQFITIAVNGDTTYEGNETFFVNLSNPSGATLATAQGTGTILNDDLQPTTLSLTSSPNPSAVGQSVTFTATVSPADATGNVIFIIDSGAPITKTLAGGLATYSTSILAVGNHSVAASYQGDSTHTASNDSLVQTVGLNNTTLSLSGSPNPSTVGQSVTFTATISPVAASGTVTFSEGATTLGTATLNGGVAPYSTSSLTVGSHTIKAVYGGDSSYVAATSAALTQSVNQASSTTTLSAAPNPASYGQSVTFTATVSPTTATGTVTFNFDSTAPVTATLDANGVATYITNTLSLGQHQVIATYNGDSKVAGSSSAPLTQTITAGAAGQVISISGSGQSATINTAFAAPLVAQVKDSSGNPVSGASVTFTAPDSGASGTFAGGNATYIGTTDSSGLITTTVFTANATAGSYTVVATVSGVGSPANFSLTNTAGTASGLAIVSGNNQQTVISTAFASPLVAKVTDGSGNAVSGVQVTFITPASGASASFGGSTVYTGATDSSGLVTSTVPTANATAGNYTVSAAIVPGTFPARALRSGATPKVTSVQYQLTNLAGAATVISAVSGSGQSATINTAFSSPLVARVVDSGSNPVSGASVTFAAPAGGASGTFAGSSATYIGTTDANGLITTTVLSANSTTGTFTVIATVSGVVSPATFSLTNVSGCNPLVVTSNLDNGSCGTLRQALVAASTGSTKTVTINLTAGSVISLTTGLTLTSGVSITTTASCGSGANNTMVPPITLQGVGVSSGNGLTLAGSNSLYGLWVRGFSGVQIKVPVGSSTLIQCVRASKL